jgi:Ca2+-binding EF-hand superfamily protein
MGKNNKSESESSKSTMFSCSVKNNGSEKIANKYFTKFSRPETLVLQRLVQQESVNGQISEYRLARVYEDMFPMGKVGKYVRIVFKMLDPENTGYIKCGQFLQFISVVARVDARERVDMCFNLLDVRKEGVLKKQDFKQVRTAICESRKFE